MGGRGVGVRASCVVTPFLNKIVNCVAGSVTVEVLFHPRGTGCIFNMRVPFAPNVVPGRGKHVTRTVKNMVDRGLVGGRILRGCLLSSSVVKGIHSTIRRFVTARRGGGRAMSLFFKRCLSGRRVSAVSRGVGRDVAGRACRGLTSDSINRGITRVTVSRITRGLAVSNTRRLVSNLNNTLNNLNNVTTKLFNNGVITEFLNVLHRPTRRFLTGGVGAVLHSGNRRVISGVVNNRISGFLSGPMDGLLRKRRRRLTRTISAVRSVCEDVVARRLPGVLRSVSVDGVIQRHVGRVSMGRARGLVFRIVSGRLGTVI